MKRALWAVTADQRRHPATGYYRTFFGTLGLDLCLLARVPHEKQTNFWLDGFIFYCKQLRAR